MLNYQITLTFLVNVSDLHFDNKNDIKVEQVAGGKQTNPLWKSNIGDEEFKAALQNSLKMWGYSI